MLPKILDEVAVVLQQFFARGSHSPAVRESGCSGLYRIYVALGRFITKSRAFVLAIRQVDCNTDTAEAANHYAELVDALAHLLSELGRHANALEIYDPGISDDFRRIFGMKSERVRFWLTVFESNGTLLKTDGRLRLLNKIPEDSEYWRLRDADPPRWVQDAETVRLDDAETVAGLIQDAEHLLAEFKLVQKRFAEFIKCHCSYADLFEGGSRGAPEQETVRRTTQIATAAGHLGGHVVSGLKVFLCHSSGDKEQVRSLFNSLSNDGFSPWLDEECLIAGQDWDSEIRKAVKESHVVVVCLSTASATKAGYVQKEIRLALDVADEQPEGTIFVIPLRLEDCVVPDRLAKWHWVDMFMPNGYKKLVRALGARWAMLQVRTT